MDTPGDASGVAVEGSYAYVADSESGLQVVDVSNPQSPAIMGRIDTPGNASGVAVAGSYAYVADNEFGLQVVDVSNPRSPAIVGSIDTPGYASGVTMAGSYAYVATDSGLQVVDVSNPRSPAIVGSVDTPDRAWSIAIAGSFAYVAAAESGLQVVDISNPRSPAIVGSWDTGYAQGVAISGSFAYVTDQQSLQIVDVAQPESPENVGDVGLWGNAVGVTIDGSLAYIADRLWGLLAVDISDPLSAMLVGSAPTTGAALGIAIVDNFAYVAGDFAGLQIVDVSNPRSPIAGRTNTGDLALGVDVAGSFSYVAVGDYGMDVVDISDPGSPEVVGHVDMPGYAQSVAVAGSFACVADWDAGLQVVDVSDPTSPAVAGSVETPGNALAVAVDGSYAYVASGNAGLQVVDISEPQSPVIVGSVSTTAAAQGVAVAGSYAYVTEGTAGLEIVDVAKPRQPVIVGSFDTPGIAQGVAVAGSFAYVADTGSGLVIDVSEPRAPAIAGFIYTSGVANGIAVAGSFAYLTDLFGLQVVDVSHPQSPEIAGSVPTGYAQAVAVAGSIVCVASDEFGLTTVRAPCHAAVVLSAASRHLPIATLGDTVSEHLTLMNSGNDTLWVGSIDLPSPDMQVDVAPPFLVLPAESKHLSLSFAPTTAAQDSGWVVFESNALASDRARLLLVWDARNLAVHARHLGAPGPLPLGQPVLVQVITDEFVHVQSGWLYDRPGKDGPYERTALTRVDSSRVGTFVGIIPGAAVRETGVEYYVEVWNGAFSATDPLGGPEAPVHLDVQIPSSLTVAARPNSGTQFVQGRPIDVFVSLPAGADFASGQLHYREAGAQSYSSTAIALHPSLGATGTIPDTSVGERGLEYWVEVETRTVPSLTFPRVNPQTNPDSIRVTVSHFAEPRTHAGQRYRMLSIPLDFSAISAVDLNTVMDELGSYDPTQWRAFRYDPAGASNIEYSAQRASQFRLEPGHAFWLISRMPHRVDTDPGVGLSTPTGRDFPITLQPGWNQIGDPFAFPVAWESVRKPDALGAERPVAFKEGLGVIGDYDPAPVQTLQPFEGYFLFLDPSKTSGSQVLWVPPIAASSENSTVFAPDHDAASSAEWTLRLEARTRRATDGSNLLGVSRQATDGLDPIDQRDPPSPPGPWVQLALVVSGGEGGSDLGRHDMYRNDFRAPGPAGHAWEIEIRSHEPAEEITVEAIAALPLPGELAVTLADREVGESVVMREPGGPLTPHRLVSFGPGRPYRLVLLAGTPDYVERERENLTVIPARTLLEPNAPNPFNAVTRIRFGLARAERVTLRIYDARGEQVQTLLDGEQEPAGYHSVLWSGKDVAGRVASSGVYFCRLTAGTATLTRRLVLLK